MNLKRRLLKYLGVGFLTLLLGGLWAFSHFFFNPFEGAFDYDLSSLIPREVDFYVSKADLADDFDPLPRPAFAPALLDDPHGQALLELDSVKALLARLDVEPALAELDRNLARLPMRRNALQIFGGEDLALAGKLAGNDLSTAEWAVYGRVDWIGKLGFELVNSGLVPLDEYGIAVAHLPQGLSLSGEQLPRPLFLTRIRDVIVLSTSQEYVSRAHTLEAARGENSFGLSAKYADHIAQLANGPEDLEAYVNWKGLAQALHLPDAWPDPNSGELPMAVAARLFQASALREGFARASFEKGATVDLSGEFNSELVSVEQRRLYREKGLERAEIQEFARLAPADVGFFLCARMPLRELLDLGTAALDEKTRGLIEDQVRSVWGHDLGPLLDDLGGAFQDRFAFFLRNNDYPEDTGADAPLHDDAPTAAWALALLVNDQATLEELRNRIHANPSSFGIAGRDASKGGIYYNEVAGGAQIIEYHIAVVPGTGLIATLAEGGRAGNYFVLGNSQFLLGQVNVTYLNQAAPPLADEHWFASLVETGLASADVVVWSNPRAISATTHAVARRAAELDLPLFIDWDVERPKIERKVKQEQFSGGVDTQADQEAFELAVQTELDQFQRQYAAEHLPAIQGDYVRPFDALELMDRGLFELTIDPKGFRMHGRIVVEFEKPTAP